LNTAFCMKEAIKSLKREAGGKIDEGRNSEERRGLYRRPPLGVALIGEAAGKKGGSFINE